MDFVGFLICYVFRSLITNNVPATNANFTRLDGKYQSEDGKSNLISVDLTRIAEIYLSVD